MKITWWVVAPRPVWFAGAARDTYYEGDRLDMSYLLPRLTLPSRMTLLIKDDLSPVAVSMQALAPYNPGQETEKPDEINSQIPISNYNLSLKRKIQYK